MSPRAREYNGKLRISNLKIEDSGEYECYLPNGESTQMILTVTNPNYITPQVRAYVHREALTGLKDKVTQQVCTAVTNIEQLDIIWVNSKKKVCIFVFIFLLKIGFFLL